MLIAEQKVFSRGCRIMFGNATLKSWKCFLRKHIYVVTIILLVQMRTEFLSTLS